MASSWELDFDPPSNAARLPPQPLFEEAVSEYPSTGPSSTLEERYNRQLDALWDAPNPPRFDPARYDELEDERRHAKRVAWSTPLATQDFDRALSDNISRNAIYQTSVVPQSGGDYSSDYYYGPEDNWLPEPPLEQPLGPDDPWAFLHVYPTGNATITYNDEHGNLLSVSNLNLNVIELNSPIIAASFEGSARDERLHLEILSRRTIQPFVRFLYTGSYCDGQCYDDVPTSLLMHAELHHIASVFDLPALKSEAWLNAKRQCEFACASPDKPIELVAALRYCYLHIDANQRIIEDTIDYCIERFYAHKLKDDQNFVVLAKERPFAIDLAKACRRRNFEDESALDIIRLQSNQAAIPEYASYEDTTNRRCLDMIEHLNRTSSNEEPRVDNTKIDAREEIRQPVMTSSLTLAIRGKEPLQQDDTDMSSSEDEGFKIVRPASDSGASTPTDSEFVLVMRTRERAQASASSVPSLDDDSDWTLA